MSKGILVVVSGFSGAGKGTVMKRLLEKYDDYALSVSVTTRAPRPGEEDGIAYFFRSREEFEQLIREDALIEYAQYVENYYGTPRSYVEEQLSEGRNVILEIEIQGAMKVKEKIPIILSKIRDKYELEDVKILVSLFMQSSSSSVYPGSYKYYGITNNNEVKFKSINYKYEDLDNISSVFYNDYIELKDTILKDIKNIYISGYTFLKEDETIKTIINITYNSNNKNSILYLNELINKIISNKFNDTNLSIYIKNNDKIKSMIFKEKSSSKVSIYMVD